jgi:hypothetical protein
MDAYVPLLAGAAAATPLTRVSRAFRSVAAVVPVDEALVVEVAPLLQPASPATATGTSTSNPDAIRQQPPAIPHPLTLRITHMTMREDSAPGVTTSSVK